MKGLILKDIINLKKQGKIILLFIAFYGVFSITTKSTSMFGVIITLMCVMLPITALSYDEKAKWDKYALTMPVSRIDMVVSKYLLGLIFCLLSGALNIVFEFIFIKDNLKESILTTSIIICIGMLFFSIVIPIIIKLGVEKGRLYMILAIFIPTGFIILLPKLGLTLPSEKTLDNYLYLLPIISVVFLLLSVCISIKIYKNKEI